MIKYDYGFKETNFIFADDNQKMKNPQANNPLHGITLENILNHLVEQYGWEQMAGQVNIRCFQFEPSVKSSLVFLRKTPWARLKVEKMYLDSLQ